MSQEAPSSEYQRSRHSSFLHLALFASLSTLIIASSLTRISDYDFWWHLKLGESILKTWDINSPDSFSYTFAGKPQFNAEWLGDSIIYIFYMMGGYYGVYLFKILTVFAVFFLLYKLILNLSGRHEPEAAFYSAVFALTLIILSIKFRLFIRPYLFSFLYFTAFLYILNIYGKRGDGRLLYLLPLIEFVWANTSKGASLGPFIIVLFVAGRFINMRSFDRPALIALLLATASSLISPEGYNIYLMTFNFGFKRDVILLGEMQPLSRSILWGGGLKYTFPYQIIVLLSFYYFIFQKGWKNAFHLLLFLSFLLWTFLMVRMIDFFSLASAIFITEPINSLCRTGSQILLKKDILKYAATPFILAITLISVGLDSAYHYGVRPKDAAFPEEAITFLDKNDIRGKLFNSYPLGGYIIWRSSERPVFVDGRGGQLYDDDFLKNYFQIVGDANAWKLAEEKWGFECAVVEYDLINNRHFPLHLNGNPEWALIYWDTHSAVYLKRNEKNNKIIEKYGYSFVKPFFNDFSYLDHFRHGEKFFHALERIESDIKLNPANQEPRLAKAFLLYNSGVNKYKGEILKEIQTSLKLKPDLSIEHSAMAILHMENGDIEDARKEAGKAVGLNPYDDIAADILKRISGRKKTK